MVVSNVRRLWKPWLLAVLVGCAPAAAASAGGSSVPASAHPADVEFIRGMLHHHEQALEMTSLVADRTTSEQIRLLARRIDISQQDEIAMMQRWLESKGVPVESEHTHAGSMPGMLTPEQMQALAAASGEEFDRLFLESMILHHQGALEMVATLFGTPGAAEEADIYQIASHVDSDQRVEIARMSRMLNELR